MSSNVEIIIEFKNNSRIYGHRSSCSNGFVKANQAYHDLSDSEISELVEISLSGDDDFRQVLARLACAHPGCLNAYHPRLIAQEIFDPAVIFHNASPACVRMLVDRISPGENSFRRKQLLRCMAWAGNAEVQSLYKIWRETPPVWVDDLSLPPHEYSYEAGWELASNGDRRDLFATIAFPFVNGTNSANDDLPAESGMYIDQRCPWCDHKLVVLLDIDSTSERVSFLGLRGSRHRVITCQDCSFYGPIFTTNNGTGDSIWHPSNVRPSNLIDITHYTVFERKLRLADKPRHFLESASWWNAPSITYSLIGGMPTWIQDAQYPNCPECSRKMPFIGQISSEDFHPYLVEFIFYCFICTKCNVMCTTCQNSDRCD